MEQLKNENLEEIVLLFMKNYLVMSMEEKKVITKFIEFAVNPIFVSSTNISNKT